MTSGLVARRIWWDGGRGFASCSEGRLSLEQPPRIRGPRIDLLDFAPDDRCYVILRRGECRREMRMQEIAEAEALLRAIFPEA